MQEMRDDPTIPFVSHHFVFDPTILPPLQSKICSQNFLLLHSLTLSKSYQTQNTRCLHKVHWCEGAAKTLWCLPEIGGHTSRGSARGSNAYANSPGNVSLHAHGGWTACRRCRSWKSAHLSGWSDASWVCDGAWRCSYSGGTWAYWGLGVRTRLRREKKNRKHADAQEGQ